MMLSRLLIVIAITIGIFAGSDCFTITNNKLINRCGVWQFVTKSSLVLLVEDKKSVNSIVTINPENITKNWTTSSNLVVTMPTVISSSASITTSIATNSSTNIVIAPPPAPVIKSFPSTLTITAAAMYYGSRVAMITGMALDNGYDYRPPVIIYCGNNNTYNNSACYQGR